MVTLDLWLRVWLLSIGRPGQRLIPLVALDDFRATACAAPGVRRALWS